MKGKELITLLDSENETNILKLLDYISSCQNVIGVGAIFYSSYGANSDVKSFPCSCVLLYRLVVLHILFSSSSVHSPD